VTDCKCLGNTADTLQFPRAVSEASESGFQGPIIRVRSHAGQDPVADDETAVLPFDEHADLGNRIGRIFTQLDDLREFEHLVERRGRDDLRGSAAGRENQNQACCDCGHPGAGYGSAH